MLSLFLPRSGIRGVEGTILVLLSFSVSGCLYSLTAGAGFPDHIRTVAILPFDNQTDRFELTDELHRQMLQRLPDALGIQMGGEDAADAVVTGTIRRYTLTTPSFRSAAGERGAEVLQREVQLGVQVRVIDLQNDLILWEATNLSARGQYLEASETEEVAREEAIELLVQAIVDGAQSNW